MLYLTFKFNESFSEYIPDVPRSVNVEKAEMIALSLIDSANNMGYLYLDDLYREFGKIDPVKFGKLRFNINTPSELLHATVHIGTDDDILVTFVLIRRK